MKLKTNSEKVAVAVMVVSFVSLIVIFAIKFSGGKADPGVKDCSVKREKIKISDPYLKGLAEQNQEMVFLKGYYKCHDAVAGDVVAYQYSNHIPPVVRIVRAASGDQFHLAYVLKEKKWSIDLNGKFLKTVDGTQAYLFGGATLPPLGLYEKPRKGFLKEREVIVLSTWSPGALDSSVFGIVSADDLSGKLEVIQ